ncbi:hypothetical protein HYFRA_00012246 [Hymenoscyphus fraxineus]|uniref:C2H2-type domain-containing protein n=1 Tax=Hymenoscyphus fraxineus TaxID=746836 RepID=A0A9N9L348_9HELO|nr:hypothetical protein HYFRA_00012246 [Hymenoscyphus fraxineus]
MATLTPTTMTIEETLLQLHQLIPQQHEELEAILSRLLVRLGPTDLSNVAMARHICVELLQVLKQLGTLKENIQQVCILRDQLTRSQESLSADIAARGDLHASLEASRQETASLKDKLVLADKNLLALQKKHCAILDALKSPSLQADATHKGDMASDRAQLSALVQQLETSADSDALQYKVKNISADAQSLQEKITSTARLAQTLHEHITAAKQDSEELRTSSKQARETMANALATFKTEVANATKAAEASQAKRNSEFQELQNKLHAAEQERDEATAKHAEAEQKMAELTAAIEKLRNVNQSVHNTPTAPSTNDKWLDHTKERKHVWEYFTLVNNSDIALVEYALAKILIPTPPCLMRKGYMHDAEDPVRVFNRYRRSSDGSHSDSEWQCLKRIVYDNQNPLEIIEGVRLCRRCKDSAYCLQVRQDSKIVWLRLVGPKPEESKQLTSYPALKTHLLVGSWRIQREFERTTNITRASLNIVINIHSGECEQHLSTNITRASLNIVIKSARPLVVVLKYATASTRASVNNISQPISLGRMREWQSNPPDPIIMDAVPVSHHWEIAYFIQNPTGVLHHGCSASFTSLGTMDAGCGASFTSIPLAYSIMDAVPVLTHLTMDAGCGASFTSLGKRVFHSESHRRTCDKCQDTFPSIQSLIEHRDKAHLFRYVSFDSGLIQSLIEYRDKAHLFRCDHDGCEIRPIYSDAIMMDAVPVFDGNLYLIQSLIEYRDKAHLFRCDHDGCGASF